jgi:GMP synthase-like glutamine amidotransferase
MGQLTKTGDEKWTYYRAYEENFPSVEDLQNLKAIIIPGSGHSTYSTKTSWIPLLKDFIRRVMNEFPHIRLIGGCFGEQSIACAMGGVVEKMPYNPENPKCLGREHIQLTDEFFQQPFVIRFMEKNDLTRETFPRMIL